MEAQSCPPTCLKRVDAHQYEALHRAQAGSTFAGLCHMLVARVGEAGGIVKDGALLAGWLGSELITGVDTT
ncbi:hypothetical protein A6V36_26505 [Paraburkholderia ginsengiterrae]|uniref:Uncharacterized protein n=1 Tax=Paraburkholderia ginsengiterrae TaxID=1462993 RepID=A0A1A9MWR9_9BURK|nr:hypothetical protein [Paraburkholderia ginsengiterrae]OAJ51726.1 hypothetical protein A6V37_37275 [Paraburkholderia ginsengiterrae]OAJ59914.1 hypothetical protein A6V36_26505 [Paraburkholderia ginsengiterrae]